MNMKILMENLADKADLLLTAAAITLPIYFLFIKRAATPEGASSDAGGSPRGEEPVLRGFDGLDPIPVPARVYLAGAAASALGTGAYLLAPHGAAARTAAPCALMTGGVLFVLAARVFFGDAVVRRNAALGAAGLISFFLLMGGIYAGGLALYGVFDAAGGARYLLLGACGTLAGIAGLYYSVKYHQDREAVAIGRRLGFVDADKGPASPDAFYDSKGVMNGVEVLFMIERTGGAGTYYLPGFRLEVFCRRADRSGVRLEVRPKGIFNALSFSSLPLVPCVPRWELYEVRSNRPDLAGKLLSETRAVKDVFAKEAGFSGMSLDEKGFKFTFSEDGDAGVAYIKRVLEAASRLSSAFSGLNPVSAGVMRDASVNLGGKT